MSQRKTKSSLLAKYLSLYEKDPGSRAFAPLAESYRKLGMIKEAFDVLKHGIQKHPTYTLGYLILGKCYFDNEDYDSCYTTLRPFVGDNTDNLILLKVFGNCCEKIGHLEEALEAYKFLLLNNPRDVEAANKVQILEEDLAVKEEPKQLPQYSDEFSSDEDDWVHVSFNEKNQDKEDEEWALLESTKKEEDEDPVVTLTLVDLYLAQGHLDKASELLSKFEELHPDNKDIKLKRTHIEKIKSNDQENQSSLETPHSQTESNSLNEEEESHNKLLNLIDRKVKKHDDRSAILEQKLEKFLELINLKAGQTS